MYHVHFDSKAFLFGKGGDCEIEEKDTFVDFSSRSYLFMKKCRKYSD